MKTERNKKRKLGLSVKYQKSTAEELCLMKEKR